MDKHVYAASTGNLVLSGAQTIDGVPVAAGRDVLAKNQTNGAENGPWTVQDGAWKRPSWANYSAAYEGLGVFVLNGIVNGRAMFQHATNVSPIALDNTPQTWIRLSAPPLDVRQSHTRYVIPGAGSANATGTEDSPFGQAAADARGYADPLLLAQADLVASGSLGIAGIARIVCAPGVYTGGAIAFIGAPSWLIEIQSPGFFVRPGNITFAARADRIVGIIGSGPVRAAITGNIIIGDNAGWHQIVVLANVGATSIIEDATLVRGPDLYMDNVGIVGVVTLTGSTHAGFISSMVNSTIGGAVTVDQLVYAAHTTFGGNVTFTVAGGAGGAFRNCTLAANFTAPAAGALFDQATAQSFEAGAGVMAGGATSADYLFENDVVLQVEIPVPVAIATDARQFLAPYAMTVLEIGTYVTVRAASAAGTCLGTVTGAGNALTAANIDLETLTNTTYEVHGLTATPAHLTLALNDPIVIAAACSAADNATGVDQMFVIRGRRTYGAPS
jgi:hypothetical protein